MLRNLAKATQLVRSRQQSKLLTLILDKFLLMNMHIESQVHEGRKREEQR